MHDVKTFDFARIAQDLQIRRFQVEAVAQLLDEGNTVPFITRYRKERTGGLDEQAIREIQFRMQALRHLGERKQTILKSIENQGKLTDALREAILAAESSKRLEDLYLPYKPKKRTLASTARERGLEPLAQAIWNQDPAVVNLSEILAGMINPEKELATPEDVLTGVGHLLAEHIAETADVRAAVRAILWDTGRLTTTKSEQLQPGQGMEYKDYFQFGEAIHRIPPHRILALNRGEKEGALKVRLEWNADAIQQVLFAGSGERPPLLPFADHAHGDFLRSVAEDALNRLLLPSLEREIRRELTEIAEEHAVSVFARNLRSLLLQAPLHGRRVLAIDPGFRTGCKVAVLDEHGNLLDQAVVYPHALHQKPRKPAPPSPAPAIEAKPLAPAAEVSAPAAPNASAETSAPSEPAPPAAPPPAPAVNQEAAPAPAASETAMSSEPTSQTAPASEVASTAPISPTEPTPATESEKKDDGRSRREESNRLKRTEAMNVLEELIRKHQVTVIAIGNGTACRETEEFVAEVISDVDRKRQAPCNPAPGAEQRATENPSSSETAPWPELAYVIVNEAGASVYSASAIGREEFPDYDATLRGTISIGRRLQDPLSELVKVDPQNIGVGLYQHDVHPRHLKGTLEAVIESAVNYVGVDLNTASVPLLRYVAGLNQLAARELVDFRKQHGPFQRREQLAEVPGIGPARYVQAAGFLRLPGGDEPLDRTSIHPESYPIARQILTELGYGPEALTDRQKTTELRDKLKSISPEEIANRLQAGLPTVQDILAALAKPGRDPREELPPPIFRKGILKLEDLQPGMELKGTVLNVVDFGAFVDVGLKDSGLVHISQMANRYIKNPYDVVSVGDVVTVWVLTVDHERRRVSLTMIRPGTERRPPVRGGETRQEQGGGRPARGRRSDQGRGPGRGSGRPQPGQAAAAGQTSGQSAPPPPAKAPPPRPAPPPRRPRRATPKPQLSQAALEGKAPLHSFSELAALLEAKQRGREKPPPREPPAPEPEVPVEGVENASGS